MPEGEIAGRKYPPILISLGVALLFSWPFLSRWDFIGPRDWELFTTMAAIPVRTVLYYHQFPFWNPYIGGGNILFAHPEVGIITPFFLLYLVFGALAGLKIQVFIAYFLGFYGSWLFARKIGLGRAAAFMASFVYFGSSYFALHFSAGHMPFTHFCFLPWLLYFVLKAEDNIRYLAGAPIAVALIILGNGAAVPLLYISFFSTLVVLLYSLEKRRLAYIKYFLFSVLAGVLLASVKFFPMLAELLRTPWEGQPGDFVPINLLPDIFFSFDQFMFRETVSAGGWDWVEYGAYIPQVAAFIALIGLIFRFKRCRLWLALAIFFLIYGLGNFASISLYGLFSHLPGFGSLRAPGRAFQFVVFPVGIMAGIGLDYLIARFRPAFSSIKYAAALLVGLIAVGNFLINLPNYAQLDYKKPPHVSFHEDFRQEIGGVNMIYEEFLGNRGSLVAPWLSAYKESRGIVTPDNQVLMEYIAEGRARVVSRKYTPDRIKYIIAPESNGTIIFSTGYDRGWRSGDGRPVFEEHGLVAVNFSPQDRELTLLYRTPHFYLWLFVWLAAIAGFTWLFLDGKALFRLKTVLD